MSLSLVGTETRVWPKLIAGVLGILLILGWIGQNFPQPQKIPTVLEIHADRDGMYYAIVLIDGHPYRMLFDSGSMTTTVTKGMAKELHYKNLVFSERYSTANGEIKSARVIFSEVSVGGLSVKNLPGSVNGGDLFAGLIGQDFLGQFHVEIKDHVMRLSS
jgi:aspartyl protease family protein